MDVIAEACTDESGDDGDSVEGNNKSLAWILVSIWEGKTQRDKGKTKNRKATNNEGSRWDANMVTLRDGEREGLMVVRHDGARQSKTLTATLKIGISPTENRSTVEYLQGTSLYVSSHRRSFWGPAHRFTVGDVKQVSSRPNDVSWWHCDTCSTASDICNMQAWVRRGVGGVGTHESTGSHPVTNASLLYEP